MKITYKILLLVISLLLVLCITIGTSYSLWKKVEIQQEQNIVESSCFSIEFSESSNINLKNAMPISDASGLKKIPYTFTIKNTCDTDSKTKIALNVLSDSTMDSSVIKFSMKYGTLANSTPVLLNTFDKGETSTNVKESYIVKEDVIRANAEKTYSIYLWMDESTGNEYMNKVFNAKVSVTSEAANIAWLDNTIETLASTDTTNFANDDPDNNIRYIGADPSNYVYFNCSDYSNQSDETCEKWRVIGVFKNITKADGTKEDLVKIRRNEKIGQYSWDASSEDNGYNDWTEAKLMQLLNSGYSSNTVNNSLYYNSQSGNCYNDGYLKYTSCDFSNSGLKNDKTRNSVENIVWNIGGNSASSGIDSLIPNISYIQERGTNVYNGHKTAWTGQIGLIYPSDYGYATSGGQTMNRNACLNSSMFNWANSDYADCKSNNYLYKENETQWTLTADANSNNHLINIYTNGNVNRYDSLSYWFPSIYPTLYLKSNISITSGVGSSSNPYQLKLQ